MNKTSGIKKHARRKANDSKPLKILQKTALCARRIKGKFFFFHSFPCCTPCEFFIRHIQTIYDTRVKLLFNLSVEKKRERETNKFKRLKILFPNPFQTKKKILFNQSEFARESWQTKIQFLHRNEF